MGHRAGERRNRNEIMPEINSLKGFVDMSNFARLFVFIITVSCSLAWAGAQTPDRERPERSAAQDRQAGEPDRPDAPPFGGPGFGPPRGNGFGGPGGPGFGPPGMNQPAIKVLERFDTDKNGWLDAEERKEARTFLESDENPRRRRGGFGPGGAPRFGGPEGPPRFGGPGGPDRPEGPRGRGQPERAEEVEGQGRPGGPDGAGRFRQPGPGGRRDFGGPGGPGGPRGPGGPGGMREPASPGKKIEKTDVHPVEGDFYDPAIFRTIFIDFDGDDWEEELELFHGTDADVAATVTIDGEAYEDVGIGFRGASSYMMIPRGSKRSFNVSMDMAHKDQRVHGYKTLNLLNCNGDASMLSSVLYSHIARKYLPAPKANLVRVVVNGENWGVFANLQQFNKEFLAENYPSSKGTRWKVSGSPQGRGGLEYFGDDEEEYKRYFEMTSDDPQAWKHLIKLCKVLKETPPEQLQQAISPMLDIDEVLWFLALDNALINSDGYWVRASDYNLYLDENKVFHLIPHDMNEAFRPAMGGPGMGGRGGFRMDGAGGPEGRRRDPEGIARDEPPEFRNRGSQPDFAPDRDRNRQQESSDNSPPRGDQRRGEIRPGQEPAPRNRIPDLDPLVGLENPRMPLLSKLLAVPELREQYLDNVRTLASESLNWEKLGPFVSQMRTLVESHVQEDTKKLSSYEVFLATTSPERSSDAGSAEAEQGPRPNRRPPGLREFIEERSKFLLEYQPKK
jgi:spore coat protein CotH